MIINDDMSSNGKFYNKSRDSYKQPSSSGEKSVIVRDIESAAPMSFAEQLNQMDDEDVQDEMQMDDQEQSCLSHM